MRSSSLIYSRQWLHGTMPEILSLGSDHFVVAQYFLTSPHAHMSGVYYCPLSEVAKHTKIEVNRVSKIVQELTDLDFLEYDHDTHIVWVINMAWYQIKSLDKTKDNRIKGLKAYLEGLPDTYLLTQFLDFYNLDINLKGAYGRGLGKGLTQGAHRGAYIRGPIPSQSDVVAVDAQNGEKTEKSGGAK